GIKRRGDRADLVVLSAAEPDAAIALPDQIVAPGGEAAGTVRPHGLRAALGGVARDESVLEDQFGREVAAVEAAAEPQVAGGEIAGDRGVEDRHRARSPPGVEAA